MQIHQIFIQDTDYPDYLRILDSPPKSIYILGKLPKQPIVAIVGTRKHSDYGKTMTYQIAGELARAGLTIASGLALGIDSFAHQAALDAGGNTIAVLAGGLDRIYPASHRNLAKRILAQGGALISEYPVGTPTYPHHFILRNRIIAGLSLGTLITESTAEGGSMHTAKFTLEANRTLMAIPGDLTRRTAAGPNNLIHEGAVPIRSSSDVLQALGLPTELIPTEVVRAQNPHEARIIELLKAGHRTTDKLILGTELTAAQFASVISLMEITGKVRNLGAGVWAPR